MDIKVCKFGGTSMADGNIILRSAQIVRSEENRRYVVVSAPGKRFSGDIKVTDLLYECAAAAENNDRAAFEDVYGKIRARFMNIETEIGKPLGVKEALDEVEEQILNGAGVD